MSIRPVDLNGVISRVQDISTMKQNEDSKPMVDQSNFQTQFKKEVQDHQKQVREADDSDNHQKKYDAKEKGNGFYFAGNRQKKDGKEEKKDKEKGKSNINKGFDMRI